MNCENYIDNLKTKFERHFNIETDIGVLDHKIDMLAKFTNVSGRTFITKHDVIDRFENFEYCYIKKFDAVNEEDINTYNQFLKRVVEECIIPGKDHMSTYVTGVIIGNSIADNVKKMVEKFSYSKAYSFYLRGWCDIRLVCIGLDNSEVITNRAGRKVKKVYQLTP